MIQEKDDTGEVCLTDDHRAARPLEDRFARVVESSTIALVVAGPGGLIEMVNRQAERMFGYDREELLDRPLEVLMPERFRGGHVALRDGFFADQCSRAMGEGQDLYGLRKDGTEFPLEIGLNPVDQDVRPTVLASIVDITARRRIEYEREQQRLELARSNADLEEFAYVASHDLKAPLRAISHLVEWIAEDIEVTASTETIDNLKLLRGRVVRLQTLLDGLLAYARIGKSRVSFEPVDIAEVVRDVVAVLSPPPSFVVECEGEMPLLRTHRTPILVVLQNLISNGLKHHDRAEGRITVSMTLEKGVAELRVADDGPGIAPRFHEKIFVIFQTLASRDDVESSGIGLAIVKKRVEGHGGRIWVESNPPARGTTMVFTWKEPTA
jgi:PAS domain S-box-containing protein